jgi:hypothetical protein
MHAVEDERHVVFACPYYSAVRERFSSLYEAAEGSISMRQSMTHANQQKVASLIHAIQKRFNEWLFVVVGYIAIAWLG